MNTKERPRDKIMIVHYPDKHQRQGKAICSPPHKRGKLIFNKTGTWADCMTALREFERLEAAGLWRASAHSQRRDVIIALGEATLTITDMQDRPLAHWSIAAVQRANPGHFPAIFHPDGDIEETIELPGDEIAMLDAIDRLQNAIEKSRPNPGRLRLLGFSVIATAVAAFLAIGLPHTMHRQALSVIPNVQRTAIGNALLARIERVTGPACHSPATNDILKTLAERSGVSRIVVFRNGIVQSQYLPGGVVLLNREFVEDFEDPSAALGAVLMERARASIQDPFSEILTIGGVRATFRLLTTGRIEPSTLDKVVEVSLSAHDRPTVPDEIALPFFEKASVSSTPYAYAIDVTGETTLGLIEADPMSYHDTPSVLSDRDWVLLQNICG